MTFKELVELDNDAEMIDLGIASLETEGGDGNNTETSNNETVSSV